MAPQIRESTWKNKVRRFNKIFCFFFYQLLYDKTLYTYSYVAVYGLCVSRNRRRTRIVKPIFRILAQVYGVSQAQLVLYNVCRLPIQRLAVSLANDKPSTILFGVSVPSTVIFGKSQS